MMARDGILSIGAQVDKTGVEPALQSIKDGVGSVVQTVAVQVEETCAKTRSAWNKLGDDVKIAAQTVSAESLNVARAMKVQTEAAMDLRRASILVKDAKIGDVESTAVLAAAQQKMAATSASVAMAKKAEAEAVARAAEEETLSQNMVIRAFQRASLSVRESLTEIQEKLAETAETGGLTAEGMAAGFSGLGKLLGAGLVVGFAGHFLDETAKMEVELAHLQEKTQISADRLAGLQQIVRESGAEWDPIATGLVKMTAALAKSVEPSKQLKDALRGIGISAEELRGIKPEEQLQKLAEAFARTEDAGNRAAAAKAVFGKAGAALIPLLVAEGAALQVNIEAASKLTGVTERSVQAAQKWQESTSRLSAEFRRTMVPTIEIVEKAVAGFLAILKAVDALVWMVVDAFGALAKSAMAAGRVIWDAMTGHLDRMKADAFLLTNDLGSIWDQYWDKMTKRWKETAALLVWQPGKGGSEHKTIAEEPATEGTGESVGGVGRPVGVGQSAATVEDPLAAMAAHEAAAQKASDDAAFAEQVAAESRAMGQYQQQAETLEQMARHEAEARLAIERAADAREISDHQRAMQRLQQLGEQRAQKEREQALRIQDAWRSAYERMSSDFSRNMTLWMTGQQSLSQSWGRTLAGMTQTVMQNLLQQAAAFITHMATMDALDQRQKLKDAAAAARSTWKSVAAIPIVGPFLAPPAAAAAFAAVEAFDLGGVVGSRMGMGGMGAHVPVLAEAGERVLTPRQTANFDRLVNQSSSSSTSITQNFHDNSNYNAIDAGGVRGMVRSHGREWRRESIRQMRLANQI